MIHVRGRILCRETTTGLNAGGTSAIPNGYGVEMIGGHEQRSGARRPGQGNVISGNNDDGVRVTFNADGTTIQGNRVGTSPTGTSSIPNGANGISINDVSNTTVGAGGAGAENIIAFNALHGVVVGDATATNNTIREPHPHEWPTGDRSRCRRCRDRERCGGCGHRSEQPPELPGSDVSERRFRRGLSPVRRTGSMSSSSSRTPRVTAPATVRQPVSSSPSI